MPNPKRVAAGRRNRLKWPGVTEAGRHRLREAALRNQPWKRSTGPRTAEGKARVALNAKRRQQHGAMSRREVRRELAGLDGVIDQLAEIRRQIQDAAG